MENFDQIFTLLAKHDSISLNTNILETGLINILVLLVILFYSGRRFLNSYLGKRKETIIKGVQDAEERLKEAKQRLSEAEKQFNQAKIVIGEIKIETKTIKKQLLESDAFQAKNDLRICFERAFATFRSKERQIFLEIKQQIISLVLSQTLNRAQKTFGSEKRATKLIDETISKLEGDLL